MTKFLPSREPVDLVIDASGLHCPMPLLRARQGLRQLEPGQRLEIISTDLASRRDFDAYVRQSSHIMEVVISEGDKLIFIIQKGDSE